MSIISDDDNFKIKHDKAPKNPVIKAEFSESDKNFENSIRPKSFDSYIGQSALKETLKITIAAAKKRELPLDHLLFYGPPGLGKTTLAGVIAEQMGVNIRITSAPALERPRDIIGILMSLKSGEILFIDEIHRLNKVAEEILYPAMEDFFLDMTTGKSQTVKTLRVPLPKFTLIGATTKAGELSGPLRDRFGIIHRLEFYTENELAEAERRDNLAEGMPRRIFEAITNSATQTQAQEEQPIRTSASDNVGNWFNRAFNRSNVGDPEQNGQVIGGEAQNISNGADEASFNDAEELSAALADNSTARVVDENELLGAMEEGTAANDNGEELSRDTYTDEQIRRFIDENAIPNDFTEEEWQRGVEIERQLRELDQIMDPSRPVNVLFTDENKENCVRNIGRGRSL